MTDSSDSVDLLQPTQAFPAMTDNAKDTTQPQVVELKTPAHDTGPKRVFAEDSDDNTPSSGWKRFVLHWMALRIELEYTVQAKPRMIPNNPEW